MTILSPSASIDGICLARAPVASIILVASTVDFFSPSTAICQPPDIFLLILAIPFITVTLCFFIRWETPPESRSATWRERATTFSRFMFTLPSISMPNSLKWEILFFNSAARRSALVGIQPQFKQTPPRFSFSITATF